MILVVLPYLYLLPLLLLLIDPSALTLSIPQKQKEEKEAKPESEFEKAFFNFLRAFDRLPQDEVPERIRRVTRNRTRETETVCELLESVSLESQQQEEDLLKKQQACSSGPGSCPCVNCPHKRELERIDEFYNEFIFTGAPNPTTNTSNNALPTAFV